MANDAMQTPADDYLRATGEAIPVVPVEGEPAQRARAAAAALTSPLCKPEEVLGPYLVVGETDAWLEMTGSQVRIAFDSASMLHRRRGGQNELLGRAVGIKAGLQPAVWDATGGLGRDAFVLADLGCQVTLYERVPVLAWLLDDAIKAAQVSGYDQVRKAAARMKVHQQDSRLLDVPPDNVLYLDPMFPERKKSAAVKKEAVMLQSLTDTLDDSESLWNWAWHQPVERIVVKRPLRAPALGPEKPSHALTGKSVRFDVFIRRGERPSPAGAGV
jgi:16S rRNA (guanine1516-N2)-methyltransferase